MLLLHLHRVGDVAAVREAFLPDSRAGPRPPSRAAVFAEVKIDPELRQIRTARLAGAFTSLCFVS
jgi:hypothetical protein